MDKLQANLIADELLVPQAGAPEPSLSGSAIAAERHRANTIRASLMLAGFACGALAAWAIGERIAKGGLLGGFAGIAIAYWVNAWRRAR